MATYNVFKRSEFVNGEYKTLESCSLSDIDWLVSDRLKRAADAAATLIRLRDAMVRHGVNHVRELPHEDSI